MVAQSEHDSLRTARVTLPEQTMMCVPFVVASMLLAVTSTEQPQGDVGRPIDGADDPRRKRGGSMTSLDEL